MRRESAFAAANALLNAGQLQAAERVCRLALEGGAALEQGEALDLRFLLGAALFRQRRFDAAVAAFGGCLAIDPRRHDIRFARSSALIEQGRKQEALQDLTACLDVRPDSAEIATALAILREDLGEHAAALELYDRALRNDPACVPARLNRGVLLLGLERPEEALTEFDALIRRAPSPAAHVNRAQALFRLFRDAEALAAAQDALTLDPRHVLAAYNHAYALAGLGRNEESAAAFRLARELDPAEFSRIAASSAYGAWGEAGPDPASIAALRGVQRQQICDWSDRESTVERVRTLSAHPPGAGLARRHHEIAFDVLALPLAPDELRAFECHVARAFTPDAAAERPVQAIPVREAGRIRVRIAFISPDFRNHPMAWLSRLLLRTLDRERFEVFAYALNADSGDRLRDALRREADRFIDVSAWTDAEVAERISSDRIDVLIECGGYCDGTRSGILALHPAPVQARYLGMPATLGMQAIDYRISDAYCTPPDRHAQWTEKLVLLPETHLVYHAPETEADPPSRVSLGLPEREIVYCCMSNPFKIEPVVFGAWMRILASVPGSVLWLYAAKELTRANLRRAAKAQGIDPHRLVFAGLEPRDKFMAAVGRADLFLDTLWFSAHTTAMDVLWAGVPVLTCPGESMASRLAASLMMAARLPELVVDDLQTYVDTAVRLAGAPVELAGYRRRLREARSNAPIFDTRSRVRAFEAAVLAMHERRLAGLPPVQLVLPGGAT